MLRSQVWLPTWLGLVGINGVQRGCIEVPDEPPDDARLVAGGAIEPGVLPDVR